MGIWKNWTESPVKRFGQLDRAIATIVIPPFQSQSIGERARLSLWAMPHHMA